MVARSGLERDGGIVVRIGGGHDATGEALMPLDEAAVLGAVREYGPRVEAFAVAASFSVRNPAHELLARALIRGVSPLPVTCAHELSSKLDAPRRALTATLNARLTPQIRHLIEALSKVLREESIEAPLMIVKGDGSLMKAGIALEYPVETILSGPAASVVGAGFLTGLTDFVVSDIGGTTTDVAVVSGGRPVISAEGALVGGWRTMVEAIDVRTCGLGGDSEVLFDRQWRLCAGPRKAMPLCLLAHKYPEVQATLKSIATQDRLPDFPSLFAHRNPQRELPAHRSPLEARIWDGLSLAPRPVSTLVRNGAGLAALRRLADAGLATVAAFTPTDAMHVLGRQHAWNRDAAECGARILATEERNGRAARAAATPEEICERTYELVVAESARVLLAATLAQDPGVECSLERRNSLGARLVEAAISGRRLSSIAHATLGLDRALVAIGAPAGAYYPEVARRLGAPLSIPEHAPVCNAVGAVAGVVAQAVDILVNQPTFKVFRVHDPAGSRDYEDSGSAIEHARRVSRELSVAAALRAGAADPHVETSISEKLAHIEAGTDYLAEAIVRSVATGRPLASR
jgi:N-methylhydantoinase A/oxoprolinase/acetone carboxylase beta subunit